MFPSFFVVLVGEGMSSEDKSHSIDNFLGALGSRRSWLEQVESSEGSTSRGRGWARSFMKGKSQIRRFVDSTQPSVGPAHVASSLTESDATFLQNKYGILGDFFVCALEGGYRVYGCDPRVVIVYEESLVVGLRFSVHPLMKDVFNRYRVVPGQLGSNSF